MRDLVIAGLFAAVVYFARIVLRVERIVMGPPDTIPFRPRVMEDE